MYKIKVRAFVQDMVNFEEYDLHDSNVNLEDNLKHIDGTFIFDEKYIYSIARIVIGIMEQYFFDGSSCYNEGKDLKYTFQYEEKPNKRVYIKFENWYPSTIAVVDFIEV